MFTRMKSQRETPAESYLIFCGLVSLQAEGRRVARTGSREQADEEGKRELKLQADLHLLEQRHFGQMSKDGLEVNLKGWAGSGR